MPLLGIPGARDSISLPDNVTSYVFLSCTLDKNYDPEVTTLRRIKSLADSRVKGTMSKIWF